MGGWGSSPPSVAPVSSSSGSGDGSEEHWSHFDNSVNAVSFGFVATAILISMFLVMAVLERFLRPRSTASGGGGRNRGDLEAQAVFNGKLNYPSPKMTTYSKGVSVLMPGDEVPTFIAHHVPAPCPSGCISPLPHQPQNLPGLLPSSSIASTN